MKEKLLKDGLHCKYGTVGDYPNYCVLSFKGLHGFDSIEKVIERVERNLCKRRKTINAERSDYRMAA